MTKYLHVVSFNIPYPANYGGVIDVYYRIKALSECSVKVILHCYEYGRTPSAELEKYCDRVYYYKRDTSLFRQLSLLPYIVNSRRNQELLNNLSKDDYPILFEGLHTTYWLPHPALKHRLKLVRTHNIEHRYYEGLSRNTHSPYKKLFFKVEAARLKRYEKVLDKADYILSLSTIDLAYFGERYRDTRSLYIPLSSEMVENTSATLPQKPYVLYHGDLSTPENRNAARFLITQVAPLDSTVRWVFAGLNPPNSLLQLAGKQENVSIRPNLRKEEMDKLINEAAINLLYTNQVSGVKLKLLNALNKGNHCLATKEMVAGSGLENLCIIIPNHPEGIIQTIRSFLHKELSQEERAQRQEVVQSLYDNKRNALQIKELL